MRGNVVAIVVFASVAGCSPEWGGGTGVGNPGTTQMVTARAHEATLEKGEGVLAGLDWTSCRGGVEIVEVGEEVDLLDSGSFTAPGGRWCALTARFEGPLKYEGTTADDARFTLELDVEAVEVTLADPLEVDETALVLELGFYGWVSKEVLGDPVSDPIEVVPGSLVHDNLAEDLAEGSALFLDQDGDGEVGAGEPTLGEGSDRDDDGSTDDDPV
jgi:hypothetical protein